ncbi:MAG: ankyrin repeat domain-containing protein [Propionibacteriales bacterium]|nr:ankyrin repeat domain-containing protein [Propionibacteriales bacterium]
MRSALLATAFALVAGCSSGPGSTGAGPVAAQPAPSVTTAPAPTPVVRAATARRLGLDALKALKQDRPARTLSLIEAGADVNVQDDIDDSVFLYAGAEGYTAVVAAAVEHGADPRVLNRYGGTALIPASEHAHLGVIRLLLDTDVDVDHVNDLGWTALGEAVALGDGGPRSQEAVRLLLAAGAAPNPVDRFGRTALQNARRLGYDEIVVILEQAATD